MQLRPKPGKLRPMSEKNTIDEDDEGGYPSLPFEHGGPRVKFLVVASDCPEARLAALFAARRARYSNAVVSLLHIIEPSDYAHWQSVAEAMRAEAYDHAEDVLADFARNVEKQWGRQPEQIIREGEMVEEIRKLIEADPAIAVLFLGAATDSNKPGPLVEALAQKPVYFGKRPIPVTVVPGTLSDEEIIKLAG